MPPRTPRTAANKGNVNVGERGKGRDGKEVFEAFEGPSRPRLIYERPGGKELPKVRVSRLVERYCGGLTVICTGNCSVWWDKNLLLE